MDFNVIKTIWMTRVKRPIKTKWVSLMSDRETIQVRKKMEALNLISAAYVWKPLPVKITLIRSAPFLSNDRKNEKFSKWNDLALNGVDTYVVDGHHRNLFDEPEVQQLADQLQQCLDKANNPDTINDPGKANNAHKADNPGRANNPDKGEK